MGREIPRTGGHGLTDRALAYNLRVLIVLIALDTLRLTWPDTSVVIRPHFRGSLSLEPDFPYSLSGDTLRVPLRESDTLLITYDPIPYEWARPRVLFPLLEGGTSESLRVIEPAPGEEALVFRGEKTIGLSFAGPGPSLDDVTRLSVSGQAGGVSVEGRMEESGFSGSSFTGELEEIDKAYLTASRGEYMLSLGNLQEEMFMGGAYGTMKFLGLSGKAGAGEMRTGYQRGSFTTKVFSGSEAYQGPYHLTEPGQVITPNSERIYLNGQLLRPGADADYILDALTGTLIFTARRPVRAEDRILCEFQVSESGKQSYFATSSLTEGPWRAEAMHIWEEFPQTAGLDSLGDTSWAWVSGARFVGSGNGTYQRSDSVFVYAGPGKGDWDVSFSYMGAGGGDYTYDNLLGGYRFVGSGAGDYSPVVRLSPPARKTYGGLEFRQQKESYALLAFARASDYDRNTFSPLDDQDNRGIGLGSEASFFGSVLSGGLAGEWRDSSFSYPFRGFSGNEDRIWGVSDAEGVEKRGAWTWLEIRPLGRVSLRPEAGLIKMAGITSFRRGAKLLAGPLTLSHNLATMSTGSWMAISESKLAGSAGLWSAGLGLAREKGDTIDVWRADGSLGSRTKGFNWGLGGLWRIDYRKTERTLSVDLGGPGRLVSWDGSYILRNWSGDTIGTDHHLSVGASLSGERWGGWGRARLLQSSRQLTEERFIYVGPGQGNWAYDPGTGSFYPYPGGDYLRQTIYLEAVEPSTERGLDFGAWGAGMGTSVSASASASEKISGGQAYYSDYSGSLFLSRVGKGPRPFAEAYGSRLSDAQGYLPRIMGSAGAKMGLRFRVHEAGFETAYESGLIGDGLEREVLRGIAYYRRTVLVGLDIRASFGRMRASEPIYNHGITAWLWELGFAPSWSQGLGPFFVNFVPQLFYRWGDRDAPLGQVFAIYPPGFSYIASASVKMGQGGSLTLSGFLRGDESGLRDKRLSVSASLIF